MKKQAGFTLVEIAIVLVIIGLLLGGVLKGQELINSAKVKSLAGDFRTISTFVYAYQDRFRALPGDDIQAVAHVAGTLAATPVAAGVARGNSRIEGTWNSVLPTDESFLFWEHVRRANLAVGSTAFGNADEIAAYLPRNSEGGRLGITGQTPGGLDPGAYSGSFYICSANISGRFARQLDQALDDGNTFTGTVRAFANDGGAGADPVAEAANLAPANDSTLYSVCVAN
jgi:prepilin-type N-terminal cleavage/methylation domain-containing protein